MSLIARPTTPSLEEMPSEGELAAYLGRLCKGSDDKRLTLLMDGATLTTTDTDYKHRPMQRIYHTPDMVARIICHWGRDLFLLNAVHKHTTVTITSIATGNRFEGLVGHFLNVDTWGPESPAGDA